jgi:hypothetical protein
MWCRVICIGKRSSGKDSKEKDSEMITYYHQALWAFHLTEDGRGLPYVCVERSSVLQIIIYPLYTTKLCGGSTEVAITLKIWKLKIQVLWPSLFRFSLGHRLKRTIPVNIAVVHAVDIAHLLPSKDPANPVMRIRNRIRKDPKLLDGSESESVAEIHL